MNNDKLKDLVNSIGKAIRHVDEEISQEYTENYPNDDNGNGGANGDTENEKQADRQRYQEFKLKYELHPDGKLHNSRYLHNYTSIDNNGDVSKYVGKYCSQDGCVLECAFWPEDGYMSKEGNIRYEDPNLDEEYYGTSNALETRRRVAAMNAEEYTKYREDSFKI
jgi:hypothetical protein